MKTFSSWKSSLSKLSDESLLKETVSCARSEREQTAWLVAHLSEIWRRDLALKRGYPDLKRYAREALGLTESMAYERVTAARLALQIPETIERLATGELSLATAADLLRKLSEAEKPKPKSMHAAPSLQSTLISTPAPTPEPPKAPTQSQKLEIFSEVLGKTREEARVVLSDWERERSGACEQPTPRPSSRRKAHSREWTELTLYLSAEQLEQLDRLRDLLSHKLKTRDPHAVFEWLIQCGLDKVDPVRKEERAQKRNASKNNASLLAEPGTERQDEESKSKPESSAPGERVHIPEPRKRAVRIRGKNRCEFVDQRTGRICGATAFLDIDHIIPLIEGGSNELSNLRLCCASHNRRRHSWRERDEAS